MTQADAVRSLYRWRKAPRGPTIGHTIRLLRAANALREDEAVGPAQRGALDPRLVRAAEQTADAAATL